MPSKDHPLTVLSKALEEARKLEAKSLAQTEFPEDTAQNTESALPQARRMRLPPILVEEAAKMIFTYWEVYAARTQGIVPVAWEKLAPAYQALWRDIVATALEMGISVVMKDAVHILDHTNGDMGGAYAKALRRYMRERLDI